MIAWLVACAAPGVDVQLARVDAWTTARPDRDPFPEHRPAETDCAPQAVSVEGTTVEIDTGQCGYVILEQPLLAPVQAGDRVEIVFWHNDLAAEGPAEAHVHFAVGGAGWLDRTVAIPSLATAYAEVVEVPEDAPAAAPLVVHLHNHGANTWNVLRFTRLASVPRR